MRSLLRTATYPLRLGLAVAGGALLLAGATTIMAVAWLSSGGGDVK